MAAEVVLHWTVGAGKLLTLETIATEWLPPIAIGAFIELLVGAAPGDEDVRDPKVLARWFGEQCQNKGITDLYMAYCRNVSAGHSGSDAIFSAGWWHGPLQIGGGGQTAVEDAKQHLTAESASQGLVGVIHASAATPEYIDMQDLVASHS